MIYLFLYLNHFDYSIVCLILSVLKTRLNSVFLLCLIGIFISFTQSILNTLEDTKDKLAIELTEEQDNDENKESKENRENKEKSETEIDDFFSHDFHFSITLFYTNLNMTDYSIGNYTNKVYDLSTPPPKFA